MRRFLVLGGAVALLAAASVAWSAQGNGEPLDSVAGGGAFGPGCFDGPDPTCFVTRRDFSVDAHGGPQGQNPMGVMYYGRNEPSAGTAPRREVLCMRVEGNRAVVGGTFLEPSAGNAVWGWSIRLEDNGPPGPGPDDRSSPMGVNTLESFVAEFPDFPKTCPPLDSAFYENTGFLPLHSGDVVVHDGN